MSRHIYAIRYGIHFAELVEFTSTREMAEVAAACPTMTYKRVDGATAHRWVRAGKHHMTGLWLDDGRIRYAPADPNG